MTYVVCPACGHFHAVTHTFDDVDAQIVALVRARFAPGERIVTADVADEVGLSARATTRRLRALSSAGVREIERVMRDARNGWYRVPGLSTPDGEDVRETTRDAGAIGELVAEGTNKPTESVFA